MKIKYKIRLVITMSIALGLILGLILAGAAREARRIGMLEQELNEVADGVFVLSLLSQDISLHPEEPRAREQWLLQHRKLGELLRATRLEDRAGEVVIERLRGGHENLRRLFDKLSSPAMQRRLPGMSEMEAEQRERLAYRMSFTAQSMVSDALTLDREMRTELTAYRRRVDAVALVLAAVVTSAIAVLVYFLGRSIVQPLTRLHEGTEAIGSGDLAYRVGTEADDELGQLSRDFDRMLDRLQEVTASREELRWEIDARTRTEEALRTSEETLKKALDIARLGNWEWDIPTGQLRWSEEVYHIFGCTPEEFAPTYQAFMDAVHPDDRARVARSVELALGGAGYDVEYRVLLPGGTVRVVHEIGEVEYDASAKPVKMFGTAQDITERKLAENNLRRANEQLAAQLIEIEGLQAKLRDQAIRDPLTGLFNRRYLDETLARELSEAERGNYPVSFVMVDIDHFKRVNDTYGHKAGDLVLQALAEQLRDHSRVGDIACRYGGEEFLLVLPHASTEMARQRAEEWRVLFEALRVRYGEQEIGATLSLGVATYPAHGNTGAAVIARADEALYAAKKGGRNRIEVYRGERGGTAIAEERRPNT